MPLLDSPYKEVVMNLVIEYQEVAFLRYRPKDYVSQQAVTVISELFWSAVQNT